MRAVSAPVCAKPAALNEGTPPDLHPRTAGKPPCVGRPRSQPAAATETNIQLIRAARRLCVQTERLSFASPVACVYNPLVYAWAPHETYLRKFAQAPKRVVFLGMNPGPFGMVQTGVPFGEVRAVRDWLGIKGWVARPTREHPRRPVTGFDCPRSEVSGQRLWGLFAARFGQPERFFADQLVMNYCPLAFLETSGANRTPDKLPAREKEQLFALCDSYLRTWAGLLQPEWIIGIGGFAFERAQEALPRNEIKLGRILHPSPASPAANRNWAAQATAQLQELGVWPEL
ncbi:Uracil-DNA glycosylase superfamily [Verrucomicrobia bacterium]|nr:Uracil-DNA glycosylase superfamily [Verrucomicrobiota bacterium]